MDRRYTVIHFKFLFLGDFFSFLKEKKSQNKSSISLP